MIAKQISTKNSGHGLVPLWQCTRQRGWIRSQILNNQFREREKVESTYFAAMEYSALYSCNFCKFNPVKWSSLILPVPKRVSFSVLMGYLVTMSCVPGDNLCWRYIFAASRESLETGECVNVVENDLSVTKGWVLSEASHRPVSYQFKLCTRTSRGGRESVYFFHCSIDNSLQ